MSTFQLGRIQNSSIWSIYRLKERIDLNPDYQRESDVWPPEKRQLLIDTIINGFDVPKIYMHKIPKQATNSQGFDYAVIDGKQRLNTIWSFITGSFPLSNNFTYFKDENISLSEFTYADMASKYPDIKADFDSYLLDVITIETEDVELIEDMFSRLNEAMPLNAAEKRNARPGPLPQAVRNIANSNRFFTKKLPFSNRRYRHYDLVAKMLLQANREHISDTKKAYIDGFFKKHEKSTEQDIKSIVDTVSSVTNEMAGIFVDHDPLLKSIGMVILYFLVFERAKKLGNISLIDRPKLSNFEECRIINKQKAEEEIANADYSLLEFNRYTQSPNDGVALRYRLSVIDDKVFDGQLGFKLDNLDVSIPE